MKQNFESIVLLVFKFLTYFFTGLVFIWIFSFQLPQFARASRTLAVVLVTFYFVLLFSGTVFGKYDVNVRKSKFVIVSVALSAFFANIITFMVLMIMNIGASENFSLNRYSPLYLILIFVIQYVIINFLVYSGSAAYFSIHRPVKSCFIVNEDTDYMKNINPFYSFKKEYDINEIIDFRHKDVYKAIDGNEHIFVINLDIEQRTSILEYCYREKKMTSYTPEIIDIAQGINTEATIKDIPLVNINLNSPTMEQRIIKRIMDIIISLVAIIFTLPIWLLVSIMIKIEDGGEVFFIQDRITLNGKTFSIIKFRSMNIDAAKETFKQAVSNDERITKVGSFIRRFRIDELPQFINVLKGDMSLVGPRPEAKESYDIITKDIPEFEYRNRVKAGITGLAQIYGRYNTTPINKLKFDLSYIESFNIWLDVKLIFQTLTVLFVRESVETNEE